MDVNECSLQPCPHVCVNLVGGYVCIPAAEDLVAPTPLTNMAGGDSVSFRLNTTGWTSSIAGLTFSYGWLSTPVEQRFHVSYLYYEESSQDRIYSLITTSGFGANLSIIVTWALQAGAPPAAGYASSGQIASIQTLSYPAPVITNLTLRLNSSEAATVTGLLILHALLYALFIRMSSNLCFHAGDVALLTVPGNGATNWVTFQGLNFGFYPEQVSVTYAVMGGFPRFPCLISPDPNAYSLNQLPGSCVNHTVVCRTATGEEVVRPSQVLLVVVCT